MSSSLAQNLIIAEARQRGWRVDEIGSNREIALITNKAGKTLLFRKGIPPQSSATGMEIAQQKYLSLEFIQQALKLPVLPSLLYSDITKARAFLEAHGSLVVKPDTGEKSQGVTVDITTLEALLLAVRKAKRYSRDALLQKYHRGQEYRLLVINGHFFAASRRVPPKVVGDGQTTVLELARRANRHPYRHPPLCYLQKINLRDIKAFLKEKVDEILPAGETLELLPISSISAGGESMDVTDQVHVSYQKASELVASHLGLFTCGLDIITSDITKPFTDYFPAIEGNSHPGFRAHQFPTAGGKSRDVTGTILDAAFGSP